MMKVFFISVFLIMNAFAGAQSTEAGYLSLDDDSIYFESSGSGEVIVLIHDGLLPGAVWDAQFTLLSENYKVIRYDRRGYGMSSPATGTYTHLDDLNKLFALLEIDSASLIACSSGGALAIDFTLKYPPKVNKLVLVGAVVGGFSYTQHFLTRGGHLPSDFGSDQEERLYYVSEDPYAIYVGNAAAKKRAIELVKRYPTRIFKRPVFQRPEVPPHKRLNEIQSPTLILVGEYDLPDLHALAGLFNTGIMNSKRIVIPRAGHLIPLEQVEVFNETVLTFLKRVE